MRNDQRAMAWIEALYREEYPAMVEYAARRLDNEDMAQELAQETFKVLLENAEELAFHVNVRGWLRQTLKNKMLAYWKSGRTDLRRFVTYEEASEQIHEPRPLEESISRLTVEEILRIARKRLSNDHYRHLIRLTVDGASHATVAKEFGISVSASEKRLERTRTALRRDFPNRRKMKIFQKNMSAFDAGGNI